jgi:hypothetical protein
MLLDCDTNFCNGSFRGPCIEPGQRSEPCISKLCGGVRLDSETAALRERRTTENGFQFADTGD